jgi:hypothetical protein
VSDYALGPEHDLINAELKLDAAYDDPEATAEQIAAAEAGHAEARVAYDDAVAASHREAEPPEAEAGL